MDKAKSVLVEEVEQIYANENGVLLFSKLGEEKSQSWITVLVRRVGR